MFRKVTDGKLSCVPYDYGTTGLAYNRKYISDDEMKEKGAQILIDEKLQGQDRRLERLAHPHLVRVAADRTRTRTTSTDMDAVWDAVRKHRDLALKYWTSGAELMSLLAEEEIYVTRRLVRPHLCAAGAGPRHRLHGSAQRLRLAGMPVRAQGLADGRHARNC